MSNRSEQRKKWKLEFINAYFGVCKEDYSWAFRRTKKYNPAIVPPSKTTIYKWINTYKGDNQHITDLEVIDSVEVESPGIIAQQEEIKRDFLHMSVVELKDYFRDSILQTIVHQNKANSLMAKMLASIEKDLDSMIPMMDTEDKMQWLGALGKTVKPFAEANKIYLDMLEKLKIKRKDLETIEKKEKKRLEITTRRVTDQDETNSGDSDG